MQRLPRAKGTAAGVAEHDEALRQEPQGVAARGCRRRGAGRKEIINNSIGYYSRSRKSLRN